MMHLMKLVDFKECQRVIKSTDLETEIQIMYSQLVTVVAFHKIIGWGGGEVEGTQSSPTGDSTWMKIPHLSVTTHLEGGSPIKKKN